SPIPAASFSSAARFSDVLLPIAEITPAPAMKTGILIIPDLKPAYQQGGVKCEILDFGRLRISGDIAYKFSNQPYTVPLYCFSLVFCNILCHGSNRTEYMLAFFRVGEFYLILLLQQHNQFQGINRIKPQSLHKKRLVVADILRFQIFQV